MANILHSIRTSLSPLACQHMPSSSLLGRKGSSPRTQRHTETKQKWHCTSSTTGYCAEEESQQCSSSEMRNASQEALQEESRGCRCSFGYHLEGKTKSLTKWAVTPSPKAPAIARGANCHVVLVHFVPVQGICLDDWACQQ